MGSKCSTSKAKPAAPKTVHIFLGFFFMVNFCLGTGFLGIPYSFYYSGYLAAIPTLLLISLVSWINATYIVECMARAQALETFKQSLTPSSSESGAGDQQATPLNTTRPLTHPNFEITIHRKFEQVEMCEMFYGKWMKYLYLVIFTVYSFLAMWSCCTVAGSAWASNIPFNFTTSNTSGVLECEEDAFQHDALPSHPRCRNAYYLSVTIFAVIVITLSLLDLKEQVIVQMILGLMRFLTVAIILLYCIVKLAQSNGGNKCLEDGMFSVNNTPFLTNATYSPTLRLFNAPGWLSAIPVFTYTFILHQGIPSLTHPIRQKQYLRWLVIAMFVTAGVLYFSLGIIVPLWFRADVQETCTLNWGEFTSTTSSVQLRILSYYIILFPSLDVLSAFPLVVHTVVVNVYMIITGSDTSKKPTHRFAKYDWLLRINLRFWAALLPILVAFGVANFIVVLKWAGLIGFAICFGFPTALQLRSIYICKKEFARMLPEAGDLSQAIQRGQPRETTPLISFQKHEAKDLRSLYMTPYSSKLLSNPVAVVIVGVIGVLIFLLTFASQFVAQETEVCYTGLDDGFYEEY